MKSHWLGAMAIALLLPVLAAAQKLPAPAAPLQIDPLAAVPTLAPLVARSESDLAPVVERYSADLQSVTRRYDATDSPDQRKRMRNFGVAWRTRLRDIDFDKLNAEGRADYVLLDNHLKHQLALLDREDKKRSETTPLLPFIDKLLALQDTRRNLITMDAPVAARSLAVIMKQVDSTRTLFEPAPPAARGGAQPDSGAKPRAATPKVSRTVANRAADNLDQARGIVTNWYRYYDGYDPMFSWWVKSPYSKLDSALARYARTLRERVVGIPTAVLVAAAARGPTGGGAINDGPIVGDPIGDAGLAEDLAHEMIPYTPNELIGLAEREYAFSLSEMKKAARDLGFGDDWKAAMETVKNTYVEPGKQPDLIRDLARQAEEYFDAHDWVTIPPLAREDWRMEMLSPERQKVSPFFLGGESILVSYPNGGHDG